MDSILIVLFLQIVLESLPISSSGHIFLAQKIFLTPIATKQFKVLDHFAHGPTMLILIILFWSEWTRLLKHLLCFNVCRQSYRRFVLLLGKIIALVVVADLITGLFYVLKSAYKPWLQSELVLGFGFLVTASSLLSLRWLNPRLRSSLTLPGAVVLGLVQGLAFLPGISRFGITYVAGRWLGISERRAFQISFLLFFPAIVAAFLQSLLKLRHLPELRSILFSPQAAFAMIVATIISYALLSLVRRWALANKLWRFGVYVVILLIGLLFSQGCAWVRLA